MDYNELQHHGVPGMKWGVRRTPAQLGRRPSSSGKVLFKKNIKKTVTKAHSSSSSETKTKTIKEMSDTELREKVNRLQLEKQYRDLSPKQLTSGQKFTKFIIKNVGNDIVLPAVKDAGKAYLTKQLKEAAGVSDGKKAT